jgi:hypothetical protein
MSLSPPPSSWEILQDFTKTAATLASGLLVLTVTFAEKVLGNGTSPETKYLLWTWVLLIMAILFSILSTASLRNYLIDKEATDPVTLSDKEKTGKTDEQKAIALQKKEEKSAQKTRRRRKRAAGFANACFFCLLLAGCGFVVVGRARLGRPETKPEMVVKDLKGAMQAFGYTGASQLRSYRTGKNDTITLQFVQRVDTFYAVVDGSTRKLISFHAAVESDSFSISVGEDSISQSAQ